MSVYAVEIDGRKALAADLPGGYVKILFEDGECLIARPLEPADDSDTGPEATVQTAPHVRPVA